MPLELTSAGRPVYLSEGTSVQLELNSPLFDEDAIKGAFSYSFGVPAAPNGPLYGWPERPDGAGRPGAQLPAELALDGLPLLRGVQRVRAASVSKYSVSLQAGLSGAGLSERLLSSFEYGGLREVPRWVAGADLSVPGLPLHANEVVANPGAYEYVFAPLRNDFVSEAVKAQPAFDPKNPHPDPLFPLSTVNQWAINPVQIGGMPAGGTFVYNTYFGVPGGVVYGTYELLPPYCPFPRLRHMLRYILEESGLGVDLAHLLPGELGDLVLVSNAVLVDRGDADTLRFSLADVVPALTVAQLLAALRQDLGLVVYQDPSTGLMRSCALQERVQPGAAGLDLSRCLAGAPEATFDEGGGLTLTSHVDAADELTKDLLSQQPEPGVLLPSVATVADLPTSAVILTENPQAGQVRLVRELDTYYVCSLAYQDSTSVRLDWKRLAPALPPVEVSGGGETQEQATCFTTELLTTLAVYGDLRAALPALAQPPYRADLEQAGAEAEKVSRSTELRLLFYNGRQPTSDGVATYPQLSHRSASGAYSLRLHGEKGTYAQWLRDWLPVKLAGLSYKQPLLLTPLDLARLDLSQPLYLAGVPYLVRKLSVAVPLRKPATAELVRLF